MTFDQPLCGRAVICMSKKATEKTDMRQNENLYLKTRIKCIVLFIVLLIKNRNQAILTGWHMRGGAYKYEGGLCMD